MLIIRNITYLHPDKEILFENLSFSVQNNQKTALIGNNGSGKSTLLKIIAGELKPFEGNVQSGSAPYYIPQHFGQFNNLTVAEALQVKEKLDALQNILSGNVSENYLNLLNDDWTIEDRCSVALSHWNTGISGLKRKMSELSGGEKTKVFLAGIMIHNPEIVLLDEPTNHLDLQGREILYDYITSCNKTLLIVSHDRALLDLLNPVYELNKAGITVYGGNYSFYREQKDIAENAVSRQFEEKVKTLKKAKRTERESVERKQRQDSRGRKKHEKEGVARIAMKKLKNQAESSSAKLKEKHSEKLKTISGELDAVKEKLPEISRMKMDFENSSLHKGKTLINAQDINFSYGNKPLWEKDQSFSINSGERINISGKNGSGKTTLIKLILEKIKPLQGKLNLADFNAVYIDQEYSLIKNDLTVYEISQKYNSDLLEEHEIKIRLSRFLFGKDSWNKQCGTLSGGEKLRLILCCLMIRSQAPDLFILDEPTNNLDLRNIEILTSTIRNYRGTIIVVSHDKYFLKEIGIERTITVN